MGLKFEGKNDSNWWFMLVYPARPFLGKGKPSISHISNFGCKGVAGSQPWLNDTK
jgi:hypothetical protein